MAGFVFLTVILMNMIFQCGVLFAFLALGEFTVWLTDISVPSSIIGMLLLTLALQLKVVKLRHVEKTADFLVHNLGFFFVPAGVGLMSCLGLIAREWMPIAGATVVSTTVILVVTGHVHQFMRRSIRQRHRHDNAGANQPTKIAD